MNIVIGVFLLISQIILTFLLCRLLYILVVDIILPEEIAEHILSKVFFIISMVILFIINVLVATMFQNKITLLSINCYIFTFICLIGIIGVFSCVTIVIKMNMEYNSE
jgi:protein-S-isoprenylcysteine O-methyltransferase Ste14